MPKNGWFHSHDKNFDVKNEAHRKIDDYLRIEHPDNRLKLFIFFTKLKNDKQSEHWLNVLKI